MNKSTFISAAQVLAVALATTLSFSAMGEGRAVVSSVRAAPQLSQSYTWYDGNRQETVWLNPQIVAEFNPSKQGTAAAKSADANAKTLSAKYSKGAVRLWKMDNAGDAALRSLATSNATGKYSPVFHATSSTGSNMRALPGNIIVYLNPTWDAAAVDGWIKAKKLEVVKKLNIGPNIYVIKTAPGLEALNKANELYLSGEVAAAFPDWWQEVSNR
ncbi:MAG: hypothetical protein HZB47_15240 [Nitrosomonadales bacterium]|nr:hypothetical protein [Nitrosomonadales bacterium]